MNQKSIYLVFLTCGIMGCSPYTKQQDCNTVPQGPVCMSAREAYAATNHSDEIVSTQKSPQESAPKKRFWHRWFGGGKDCSDCDVRPKDYGDLYPEDLKKYGYERPIDPPESNVMRKKPDVLRVWISPWESKDNDLHMPGYVYTEIDDSRWLVGEQVYRHGGNITPLSIRKPKSESDASDQKSGQNKSGQMYPGSK